MPTQVYSKDGVYYADEVQLGDTAVLKCGSNVKHYFFDFWIVDKKNLVIGPSNEGYDKGKYKYEILSGNLTIKASGRQQKYIIRTKLIVNYDWQKVEQHSSSVSRARTAH
nr:unnamed protein product [Callosobruchus chinensis]